MTLPDPLLSFMISMSQKYCGSEWADGWEFFLWREIHGRALPRNTPMLEPYERDHLERMSDNQDSWWMLNDDLDWEHFTIDEWCCVYAEEFGDDVA